MSMQGPDAPGWPGDDVEVPPHGLDLDAIVQVGRRQVRRRRMAAAGGTAAVLAAVVAIPAMMAWRTSTSGGPTGVWPASSGPLPLLDCDATALPLPAEYAEPEPETYPYALLTAMDPTGRYAIGNAYLQRLGNAGDSSVPDGVVVWDDGRPTMPSPLRGYTEAQDVNPDGVVVGYNSTGGQAWIYRDGRVSRLPTPDGYDSAEAKAINAAGDVAGTAAVDDGSQTMVVWPADDRDNPRVLAAPPGRDVVASGITDDGLVLGEYYAEDQGGDGPAGTGVYLWQPDGTRVELPVPDGAYDVLGTAVRGNWAVGTVMVEPEGPQQTAQPPSLRWDLSIRKLQLVPATGGVPNQVTDVSAAGDLLFLVPPAVIRGGDAYALPDPVEEGTVTPPDTAYDVYVQSISDDGSMIAGNVYFKDAPGQDAAVAHPVMWRC
jgi:hypothetical protein